VVAARASVAAQASSGQAEDGTDETQRAGAVRGALQRAVDHLTGLQDAEGWWRGELETNVTMDAEDLLLREFLGIRTRPETAAAARWIRSCQRPDGTWANFHGGDADLSTTVEAYVALRLAGDRPEAPHLTIAADWIRAHGGIEGTRVFTRIWLALFGEWPWDDLPVMPPELIYLPRWFPLNVYDWACWARQTIVPLTIVCSLRPVRPLPFGLPELRAGQRPASQPPGQPSKARAGRLADPWKAVFQGLDKALHGYERYLGPRAPAGALRSAAMRRCADWIIARQERDGCWGGIQPPWVYSLLALHLLGYGLDHPVISRGLAGLDRFTVIEDGPQGPLRRLEACQSPVWDTALAVVALADAGVPASHPAQQSAAAWLLAEEIRGPGDWQVRRPQLAPAGWAFEFDNDGYPDIDDTAEVLLALRRTAVAAAGPGGLAGQASQACARAIAWLTGMQSREGGWGEDLRSYTDPSWAGRGDSTASQTAWAMLALLAAGGDDALRGAEAGAAWLAATQRPDGSWDEPQFTGTGFPGDFYINYHLYRLVFPISALGRYLAGAR
jgi:squalene-hopene/tetraprenyl-beta-curcumene cyclase